MRIRLNGAERELPAGTSVAELVARETSGPVAVERNGELVPRARHAGTELADGDRVEIVTLVGGG